jgi:hypothetical protein
MLQPTSMRNLKFSSVTAGIQSCVATRNNGACRDSAGDKSLRARPTQNDNCRTASPDCVQRARLHSRFHKRRADDCQDALDLQQERRRSHRRSDG